MAFSLSSYAKAFFTQMPSYQYKMVVQPPAPGFYLAHETVAPMGLPPEVQAQIDQSKARLKKAYDDIGDAVGDVCCPLQSPFGICCPNNYWQRIAGGIFYLTQQATTISASVLGVLSKLTPNTLGIASGSQALYWIALALQVLEVIISRIKLYKTRVSFNEQLSFQNMKLIDVEHTSLLCTLPIPILGLIASVVFAAVGYYDAALSTELQTIFVGLAAPLSKLVLNFDKQLIDAHMKGLIDEGATPPTLSCCNNV